MSDPDATETVVYSITDEQGKNLQIVFIHEYRGRRKLEMFYFIGSLSLASILSLIPFSENMYGWNEPEGLCFFRDSGTKTSIIWQWASFYAWELLCILYCTITLICVAVKLYKVSSQSVNTNISGQTVSSRYEKNVLRNKAIISLVVKRVIWYPVVPIITQAPNFLVETDIYVNQKINFAFLVLATFITFQGFLNTIVFMQDLAVSRAYRLTKLSWWYNHVNKYEELYPHLSRNKAFDQLDLTNEIEVKNGLQKQPSFVENLRYDLLTLLFSKPKGDKMLIEYDQFMTVRDDEEFLTQPINDKIDDGAIIKDDDSTLNKFNKNVLCKL
ncbi:17255_t:CDS:2 [Entrophospora sp. SA101]|nr:5769_t:CDS:2 [Entrophospora sp. SA101]CAJ0761551.1 17255_t:CDS:2 [Entrophospora sp. SA101]